MLTHERAFFLALFLLLASSAFLSNYWHDFAYKQPSISLALYAFDKAASDNACAEILIIPKNAGKAEHELRAYVDSKEVLRKKVFVSDATKEQLCFDLNGFPYGTHFAEIFLGERRLFYSFEKTAEAKGLAKPEIEIIGFKNSMLSFRIKNFPSSIYAPVEIFVNGTFAKAIYPSSQEQEFNERISLAYGKNTVEIKAFGASANIDTTNEHAESNLFLGIIFMLLGIAVFAFFVFPNEQFFSRFALSIALLLALFVALGLFLGFIKRFALVELSAAYCLALALIAFAFRKNFSLKEQKVAFGNILKNLSFEAIVVAFFFLYAMLFYGLFIPNHRTYFNVFYERATQQIIENAGVPEKDELSYLGRTFTFIPGYFYIEGAISLLTGLKDWQLFAVMCTLASMLLLLSSVALAEKLGLKRSQLLFPVFISMSTVVFSYITLTPRHSIAYAFLMISLMLMLERRTLANAAMLFFTMMIQIPAGIMFLISAPFLNAIAKRNARDAVLASLKPLALAIVAFVPAYAFLFWHAGLPYQIVPRTWGYLISLGPELAFANPGILFFLFVLMLVLEGFYLLKGSGLSTQMKKSQALHASTKISFAGAKRLLLIASFFSLFLQCFVSSRFDVLSTLFMALFVCYSIESHQEKFSEFFTAMLALVLLIGLYLAIILSQGFTVSTPVNAATEFLAHHSSFSENVLADPYYGHLIEFDAGRKTLADLMVEYADEQKLSDSYRFLKEKDYRILEKYNIAIVFSERFLINEKLIDNAPLPKELEFEALAKVFTNEKISIHRVLR